MSDLFSAYAATTGARDTIKDWDNKRATFNGGVKDLSPLEKKMREKQRLSKSYMRWRRQETKEVVLSEPRLKNFLKFLRTVQPETGGDLIDAISVCEWLRSAPLKVRIFALRMIDARCNKINQQLGNDILDDPIPPETSIYFQAKAILCG